MVLVSDAQDPSLSRVTVIISNLILLRYQIPLHKPCSFIDDISPLLAFQEQDCTHPVEDINGKFHMGRIKVVVITGGMPKFEVKNVDFQGGGANAKK